jgi:hypothetical protein
MGVLVDRIAEMRNPVIYAVDVVGGVRSLGFSGSRRVIVSNLVMSGVVGAVVTAVGGGAVEAATVVVPATVPSVLNSTGAEAGGICLAASVVAGLVQGVHQISKEGEAARRSRGRRTRRSSQWLL